MLKIEHIKKLSHFMFLLLLITSCVDEEKKEPLNSNLEIVLNTKVNPEPFPDLGIPNFSFPTDSTVINSWVKNEELEKIYKHGWGIWAGLTKATPQKEGSNNLLVFETWLTPKEILDSINNRPIVRVGRSNLNKPNQLIHAKKLSKTQDDTDTSESVSYSPSAATYSINNKIFMATTLAKYMNEGKTEIPDFPNDAITIKPVFKLITKDKLNSDGIYAMASWHGPIDTVKAYPQKDWKSCVYVDINNQGKGNGSMDMNCSSMTPETTYNLSDFIHFKINQEDADYYNQQFGLKATSGDYALLVAMHVTSREIKRWTWQTFWWTPDPVNPPAPSSNTIASYRPINYLEGAANHYAMSSAYAMVSPVQPYVNGKSVGDTIIAFNPYLEAGFGPDVFKGSQSFVVKNGTKISTDAGVRTNCMSCHAYASYNVKNPKDSAPYSGDAYVSLNDTIFRNKIKLDFAWSIQGNIDTTGIAAYIRKLNTN